MVAKEMYMNNEKGVGLTEVLVSLVLLAIAILGFVAFQTRAISLTSESMLRVNALTVMRDLGDSIRHNVSGKNKYKSKLNGFTDDFVTNGSANAPSEFCGLSSSSTFTANAVTYCGKDNQATIAAYKAAKTAYENGYQLKMQSCPGTNNGLQCLIAAWNDTNPTVGSSNTDCVKTTGLYVDNSECLIMEIL